MSLSFREIANRITGFSIPIFGVSWSPPKLDVQAARQIVTYLEDRRALYNPYELEMPGHVVESILQIRQRLTHELEQLDRSSPLAESLSAMRVACRKFLDTVQGFDKQRRYYPGSSMVLFSAVGELRGVFGIHLAHICVRYGIDVEGDLATILPAVPEAEKELGKPARSKRNPKH